MNWVKWSGRLGLSGWSGSVGTGVPKTHRAPKTTETPRFGSSRGKTEWTPAMGLKYWSCYPSELLGLIHKRPHHDPFFAKKPFSPADEFVFMGLVVRSCHFDVTACAEARRLDKHSIFCTMRCTLQYDTHSAHVSRI